MLTSSKRSKSGAMICATALWRPLPRHPAPTVVLLGVLLLAPAAFGSEPPAASEEKRLSTAVAEAQKLVERVRGVRFREPIRSEQIEERDLPPFLERKLVEDLPAPFPKYAAALAALGLIDPTPSLQKKVVNLYSRQVAGFYDPEEKKFYIVPGRTKVTSEEAPGDAPLGTLIEESLLVHELTHALQDQRLGLAARIRKLRDSTDSLMALQAVLEGEATVVMAEALFERLPAETRASFSGESLAAMMSNLATSSAASAIEGAEGVPEFFIRELLFPYSAGTAWIQHQRAGNKGWTALDEGYGRFPATTSEILRPGRTGPRNRLPSDRASSPPLPEGCRFLFADTLGEWVLGFLLERAGAGEGASRLAESWNDDRIVFFEPRHASGAQVGFTWRIRTSNRAAAVKLADALAPLYTARPARLRPTIEVRDDIVEVSRGPAPAALSPSLAGPPEELPEAPRKAEPR